VEIGAARSVRSCGLGVESNPGETFHGAGSAVRLQPVTGQTPATTAAGISTTGTSTASASTPTSASTMSPPTAPNGTVISYATMVDVSNPDEKLRPGMTAT